jgi:hypothetical protein
MVGTTTVFWILPGLPTGDDAETVDAEDETDAKAKAELDA